MRGKIAILLGAGIGYVLGTRDGRERYEQLKARATGLWDDPTIQHKLRSVTGADRGSSTPPSGRRSGSATADEGPHA